MKEKLTPMRAIGRISNPFIYEAETLYCGSLDVMSELTLHLKLKAEDGWKLHTIKREADKRFFIVWEKLDYTERK